RSGADGQNLPAHGGGIRGRNRVPGAGRLRSQLAPGYALRKLAPQPTRTRTNNPEEWESTEHLGLDSAEANSPVSMGNVLSRSKRDQVIAGGVWDGRCSGLSTRRVRRKTASDCLKFARVDLFSTG